MLDELVLGGEIQETSKKNVLKAISAQDLLQEVCGTFLQTSYHSFFFFCPCVHLIEGWKDCLEQTVVFQKTMSAFSILVFSLL